MRSPSHSEGGVQEIQTHERSANKEPGCVNMTKSYIKHIGILGHEVA